MSKYTAVCPNCGARYCADIEEPEECPYCDMGAEDEEVEDDAV